MIKLCRKAPKPRHIFLFNDMLLYASSEKVPSPVGTNLKILQFHSIRTFDLYNVSIRDVPSQPNFEHAFEFLTGTKSFLVFASSSEEKSNWIAFFALAKEMCLQLHHVSQPRSFLFFSFLLAPTSSSSFCLPSHWGPGRDSGRFSLSFLPFLLPIPLRSISPSLVVSCYCLDTGNAGSKRQGNPVFIKISILIVVTVIDGLLKIEAENGLAPVWVPDQLCESCMLCHDRFTFTNRRVNFLIHMESVSKILIFLPASLQEMWENSLWNLLQAQSRLAKSWEFQSVRRMPRPADQYGR